MCQETEELMNRETEKPRKWGSWFAGCWLRVYWLLVAGCGFGECGVGIGEVFFGLVPSAGRSFGFIRRPDAIQSGLLILLRMTGSVYNYVPAYPGSIQSNVPTNAGSPRLPTPNVILSAADRMGGVVEGSHGAGSILRT